MIRPVTLVWNVNVSVSNKILRKFIEKSWMIREEFYVENYDVDFLGGRPLNLYSKHGDTSCKLYFEDIEWAIKDWCKNFSSVSPYLCGHYVFLENLKSEDINYILDDAIVHSLRIEDEY